MMRCPACFNVIMAEDERCMSCNYPNGTWRKK